MAGEYITKPEILSLKERVAYIKCALPEDALREIRPGNFFNISVAGGLKPFLRRPISVCFTDSDSVYFLIKIVGEGTKAIVEAKSLSLLGPLGNSFSCPDGKSVFICGGIGIAPLHFLKKINSFVPLIWGIRSREEYALYPKGIIDMADEVFVDGENPLPVSLPQLLDRFSPSVVYACANIKLTELIIKFASGKGIAVEASLEAHMGCGWGACNGCFVSVGGKSVYVCKEGPVVRYN